MKDITDLLFILGVLIVIFFACRAIILWYYKIDTRVALMKRQEELLKQILAQLQAKDKVPMP